MISLNLSVHELVDFLLRKGDIDNRIYNQDTMKLGSEIHSIYQKRRVGNYLSEYYLKEKFIIDEYCITIDGRADGIYLNDIPTIEEIKTTVDDLDKYYEDNKSWHLGQSKCYAYMYMKEKELSNINISLTYISQINDDKKKYDFMFNFDELEEYVYSLLNEYLAFYRNITKHIENRNITSKNLPFPFIKIRKGQSSFINEAYSKALNGGISFIEASTGIGKTMSAIFPSIKSFSETNNKKIFYLTAKNTGKDAAYQACKILVNSGLDIFGIYITAKEKICFSKGCSCNPDECIYAKGYYTKLKEALIYALNNKKLYNSDEIVEVCNKFQICPFEFSLDLSNFMDIVIADYNYFFDPIVYLERYFSTNSKDYFLLIDEAHNLLDRASEMYSENITFFLLKECQIDYRNSNNKLKKSFTRLEREFKELLSTFDIGSFVLDDLPHELYLAFMNLYSNLNDFLKENKFHPNEFSISFSRKLNRFLKLYDNLSEEDAIYIEKKNDEDFSINLYCIDPSKRIRRSLDSVKGAILFSATLTPIDYYKNVLGGKDDDSTLIIPSPFPKDNFKLIIADASLKYKDRDISLNKVISYIDSFINAKKGNYLIFAPSFEYLDKLLPYFMNKEYQEIYIQDKEMNEYEKMRFLSHFKKQNERSVIGIVVVGGAFSEGIDLVSDSLIGVIVIGVGLPTISFKRNLIKDYYDKKDINFSGFSYAYKHPGMNKVTQAVGRVIRSEYDVGAALLIDNRYLTNSYRRLFKKEWDDYDVACSDKKIKETLKEFWNKH